MAHLNTWEAVLVLWGFREAGYDGSCVKFCRLNFPSLIDEFSV